MTAFTASDLPSDLDSVEKVVAWGLEVLQYNYVDKTSIEAEDEFGDGIPVPVIETQRYYINTKEIKTWRYMARVSLPISKEFQASGQLYKHVLPLGESAIPAAMRRQAA